MARLDVPPPDDRAAALDPGFGTRALIFVDTEEEFDWSGPRQREGSVAAIAALPALHARFVDAGFRPVYLVTHPIAVDPASQALIGGWCAGGTATIGTQLHPWVTPPFDEPLTPFNSFVGNLPEALERAKLAGLTQMIAEGFGVRPTVYRAGRYGIGRHSARLLIENGYRLDTSVRPHFDYRAEGGPDFTRHHVMPFWADEERRLLALPLGTGFIGGLRAAGSGLYRAAMRLPKGGALLARSRLLARVTLTPEGVPLADALALVDALLGEGVQALSFSFHSPSAAPGHTPYVRTPADLDRFVAWWEGMFAGLARRGVTPASVEQFIAAAAAGAGQGSRR